MTKKQYLNVLENKLRFRVSAEELRDIMSDMEECFEAGAAEGRTEEEIAAGLGSPAAAAKELSSGIKITADPIIRTAACIFITLLLHYVMLETEAELFVPMIFLPLLFLMICELPKSPLRSIAEYPADIIPLISALLLPVSGNFLGCFFSYVFIAETHKYAGISVILFMAAAALSTVLLLISFIKTKRTIKALLSGGLTLYTVVTLVRMAAAIVKYPLYENVIGALGIAKALFAVLFLSSYLSLLCTVNDKNALKAAALYPSLFTIAYASRLWLAASRIDPYSSIFQPIGYGYYLSGGMICTAAALAAILQIRRSRRAENG
ncbi:MAG: DUF1700 domain-containing protein [Oscillospiraceae bacterium]|nr:DUF1700 domain-containing protein [Oscillospiraceae bacterium]